MADKKCPACGGEGKVTVFHGDRKVPWTHQCGDCVFWRKDYISWSEGQDLASAVKGPAIAGRCTRNAPVGASNTRTQDHAWAVWPLTYGDMYCGDFTKKNDLLHASYACIVVARNEAEKEKPEKGEPNKADVSN